LYYIQVKYPKVFNNIRVIGRDSLTCTERERQRKEREGRQRERDKYNDK